MCKDGQRCDSAKEIEKDMSNSNSKIAESRIEIKQTSHLHASTGTTSNKRAGNESKEHKEEEVRVMERGKGNRQDRMKPATSNSRQKQIPG